LNVVYSELCLYLCIIKNQNKMKHFKVTHKFHDGIKWCIGYRLLFANSPEDAVKKMDLFPELIINVELL
jgi:hypothetical protein